MALDPKRIDASTDLGICYFYTNQVDRALAQFDKSLALDPNHLKTLLNVGIVRAFGKGDRPGAAQAWERVVAIAPESEEATLAKQGLDGLRGQGGASSAGPERTRRAVITASLIWIIRTLVILLIVRLVLRALFSRQLDARRQQAGPGRAHRTRRRRARPRSTVRHVHPQVARDRRRPRRTRARYFCSTTCRDTYEHRSAAS